MTLSTPIGYLYWYTTSVILALLTLFNVITKVYNHCSSKLSSSPTSLPLARPATSPWTLEHGCPERRPIPFATRLLRAVSVAYNRYFLLTSLSVSVLPSKRKHFHIPTTQLTWTLLYTAGVLILSFWGTSFDLTLCAHQAAWVSVAQVPLIMALAGKNNLISCMTGISYEKLNFLHRAAGRLCLVGIWVHSAGQLYLNQGLNHLLWKLPFFQWGLIGLISYTLLTAVSLRWVRQRFYELFLVSHILLIIVTLVAFILHWKNIGIWIYPGIGLWVADRLIRASRLLLLNSSPQTSTATIASHGASAIIITIPTPSSYLKWKAGQHFYLTMPGVTRLPWEAHPFTAASIPTSDGGNLQFVVGVRDGFTRRLRDRLGEERRLRNLGKDEEVTLGVAGAVDGPYGVARDLSHHDGVLLVAGGSGISFAISHLSRIVQSSREGGTVKMVQLVWMIKSKTHLDWIVPMLQTHLRDLPSSIRVQIHLFVTARRSPTASVESKGVNEIGADQLTPRRLSRLMSTLSWVTWTDPADRRRASSSSRRGSSIVLSQSSEKTPEESISKSSDLGTEWGREAEKQLEVHVVNTLDFGWSDGYAENTTIPIPAGRDLGRRTDYQLSYDVPPDSKPEIDLHQAYKQHVQERRTSSTRSLIPSSRSRKISIVEPPRESLDIYTTIPRKKSSAVFSSRTSDSNLLSVSLQPSIDFGSSYASEPMSRSSSSRSDLSFSSFDSSLSIVPKSTESPDQVTQYDRYIRWFEGRADLARIIDEMKESVGNGGRVSVNACGPSSLLRAVKEVVKAQSSIRGAMRGDAIVDLHLETFGW